MLEPSTAIAFGHRLLPTTTAAAIPEWARSIGVTRVARVTGLDRCGVEVACAIRPEGVVLQVSNGKGDTFSEARLAALGEALELWACEHPRPDQLIHLREQLSAEFWPVEFLDPGGAWVARQPSSLQVWARAQRLDGAGEVHIPAAAVWSPANGLSVGLRLRPWTANGMAVHPVKQKAHWHGLLEVLEREALCRLFPDGWTPEHMRRRLRWDDPLVSRLQVLGFQVVLVDATPAGWPVPVVAALLVAPEGQAPLLAAGYACRPSPEHAARAALLEACQSRLTEIHGAREDVTQAESEVPDWLLGLSAPRRGFDKLPTWDGPLRGLLKALGVAAAAVDMSHPDIPLHITRVFVPGFRMSELLL